MNNKKIQLDFGWGLNHCFVNFYLSPALFASSSGIAFASKRRNQDAHKLANNPEFNNTLLIGFRETCQSHPD